MGTLNRQILIASLIGIIFGCLLHPLPADNLWREGTLYGASLIAAVFIGLLKMLLVPLIFLPPCVPVLPSCNITSRAARSGV